MTYTIDPRRTVPPIRPLKAMKHMKALLKDNDDTEQVFHIMEALSGKSFLRDLKKFAALEKGAERLRERENLPELLDNHDALRTLPDGTVGRAYLDFMEREGLTAAGLVSESEKWWSKQERYDDDFQYYAERRRDTHDLFHVLTGYGRDQLGEISVLAFTHSQHGGFGNLFIAYIGAVDLAKKAPRGLKAFSVINEGRRIGKRSAYIAAENIPELLREPLHVARKRLNISEPVEYKRALKFLQSAGFDFRYAAA